MSFVLWSALVLAGLGLSGCGDKSRRLTENETLEYKRSLVISRQREIGPGQARQLFYHPARTRGEIDRAFQKYVEEYSSEQSRDAAQFSRNREPTRTGPEPDDGDPSSPGSTDAAGSSKAAERARKDAERLSNPPSGAGVHKDDARKDDSSEESSPALPESASPKSASPK